MQELDFNAWDDMCAWLDNFGALWPTNIATSWRARANPIETLAWNGFLSLLEGQEGRIWKFQVHRRDQRTQIAQI